jgi:hypothetical protein
MRTDRRPPSRGDTFTGCPPRLRRFGLAASAAVVLLGGCRANKKYDLIEAELRTRDRELAETRAELENCRLLNQTYQRQGPGCPVPVGPGVPAFHGASAGVPTLPLRDVVLGNGTGGVDNDDCPGDESFAVMLVPHDDDGTPIKVPGRLAVSACEITREGLKIPIGRWEVPPDQLRRAWKSGLLSTGYMVPLQWDKLPTTTRVRLTVRFTTLDGRDFEADKDITVRPLPNAGPPPVSGGGPPVVIPPRSEPPVEVPADPASRIRGPVEELPPPAARLGTVQGIP